jgi:choice-of-anchor A domain-containing protein
MLNPLTQQRSIFSLALLLTSLPALATPLGTADMFNAYATGNMTYGSVDIEGVIGSSGNITFNGGDTGRKANGPYTIYSGGDVNITNHHIYHGGVQAGGNVSISGTSVDGSISNKGATTLTNMGFGVPAASVTSGGNVTFSGMSLNGSVYTGGNFVGGNGAGVTGKVTASGTVTAPSWYLKGGYEEGAVPPVVNIIDHQQVAQDIQNASNAYAQMDASGAVLNPYAEQWIFDGDQSLNIFDFNGADLAHITQFTFDGARDATYVFNISGTDISFGSNGDKIGGWLYNFEGFIEKMQVGLFDDISSRILFNFYEATSLDIYGSVFGSILAPSADVYVYGGTLGGAINGSLYAKNISGDGQINNISFDGEEPRQVPEPASLALLAIGLVPLLMRRRGNKTTFAA